MTRVLVTGGNGLVGRQVVATLLALGRKPRVVGRGAPPAGLDSRVDHVTADLIGLDERGLRALTEDCDTLVHLAWETRHGLFWQAPENLDWVTASVRLVKAFTERGGRRFIGAGTCVEYQPPSEGPCIPGRTPVVPTHLYAVAKNAFHRQLAARAAETGLSYAWGRVFLLIGPGEPEARLVPTLIKSLLAGTTVACSSGRQDVRDAGEAFAWLATSEATGAFNICSGQPVTVARVAKTVGRLLGKEHLVALGARPDRDEPPNLWGDIAQLREATGFAPRYPLEAALQHAIDGWQNPHAAH